MDDGRLFELIGMNEDAITSELIRPIDIRESTTVFIRTI
jgi:hypothetical protein